MFTNEISIDLWYKYVCSWEQILISKWKENSCDRLITIIVDCSSYWKSKLMTLMISPSSSTEVPEQWIVPYQPICQVGRRSWPRGRPVWGPWRTPRSRFGGRCRYLSHWGSTPRRCLQNQIRSVRSRYCREL